MKQKTFVYRGTPETGIWTVCDKYKIKKVHIQGMTGQEFEFYPKDRANGVIGSIKIGLSDCCDLDFSNTKYYIEKITSNITTSLPEPTYCSVTIFYE